MKRKIGLAVASILVTALFLPLSAQEGKTQRSAKTERVELVAKLRSDLSRATLNLDISEKQRAKLERIVEKLTEAEAALRRGGAISPIKMLRMRGAINDLERLAEGGVFEARDRQLVLDDLRRLKQNRPTEGVE